jgi:hypothetical protein
MHALLSVVFSVVGVLWLIWVVRDEVERRGFAVYFQTTKRAVLFSSRRQARAVAQRNGAMLCRARRPGFAIPGPFAFAATDHCGEEVILERIE